MTSFSLRHTSPLLRLQTLCALMGVLLLTACGGAGPMGMGSNKLYTSNGQNRQPQMQGNYKVGNPYRVGGDWYYPKEEFKYVETGLASWYGPTFHGKHTANGEVYDQNELTGAHRTLQMPSLVRVTNLVNGKSIVVRINDRGPFMKGRVLDVSKRAAELLGFIGQGTARVKIEVLENASRQIASAAKNGVDVKKLNLSDLAQMDNPTVKMKETPVYSQTASAGGTAENVMMPESLMTPTITVEQLSAPIRKGGGVQAMTATPVADVTPAQGIGAYGDEMAEPPIPPVAANGHVDNKGRFLPGPVVTTVPVAPTGLYVQAGAFGVYDNAQRLSEQLQQSVGPTKIETVNVNGKQLYRVKIGPIASITEADAMLAKASKLAAGARVIH